MAHDTTARLAGPKRTRWACVAIVTICGYAGIAFGQAPDSKPSSSGVPSDSKQPALAASLSLGGFVLGAALSAAGAREDSDWETSLGLTLVLFGPSAGRWYSGSHALGTLALRGIGTLMLSKAAVTIIDETENGDEFSCGILSQRQCMAARAESDARLLRAEIMFFTGLGLVVSTTVYDIVLARNDARAYNADHALRLEPLIQPSVGGSSVGLNLRGRF